jgi:hypothetical protein
MMNYPEFFNEVETIEMVDPLSNVLGAFEGGELTFNYLDVVKSAGHSCPTVAGAYLMTLKALKALYPHETPVRGNIKVAFKEPMEEGVAGVIGNVVAQLTGATDKSGFKGLNGKFARHSLMDFTADINSSARFTRVDTGVSVDVYYNPTVVPPLPDMQPLMQKVMGGTAEPEDIKAFGIFWQERVERILINNSDNAEMIRIEDV